MQELSAFTLPEMCPMPENLCPGKMTAQARALPKLEKYLPDLPPLLGMYVLSRFFVEVSILIFGL